MQEVMLARSKGARVRHDAEAERFLEDSADIVIENQGRLVASLFGLQFNAGGVTFPQKPGLFHYGKNDEWVSMKIYSCKRLVWAHAGAMCLLQGMPAHAVLGPTWVVLDGKPTMPGDPLPGIHSVILADVFENVLHRPHMEIFKVARENLGLAI
jgi:hypothetical protein